MKDWDIQINYGIKTGFNDAFIISTQKRDEILANCKTEDERNKTAELIRPILRGRDIKRYGYEWADLWIINTHNGIKEKNIPPIDINDYPAIKAHLDKYWDKISKRDDKGITPYNLRNCAYMDDFFQQKIVYAEIVQSPRFYLDNGKFFPEATTFILTGKNLKYLINLFNAPSLSFIFKNFYAGGGLSENGYRYKKVFFENLPIPLYDATVLQRKIEDTTDVQEINRLVYKLYNLTSEEIDFIENSIN